MIKRAIVSTLAFAVIFFITGCGNTTDTPEGSAKIPKSASTFEGNQYQEVVSDLSDAGFTNIETEALGDLITGWLNGDGEVKEVYVDGETDFSAGDEFPTDASIVVAYHSFAKDASAEASPTPGGSVEASVEVLTTENNKEFATILGLGDYCSSVISDFAAKHEGQTIEFDGNIGAMNNHGNYKTRYDILIGAGDFSETSQPGPAFQFRDVNVFDLNLTGDGDRDTVGAGDNLRITAEVGEYESSSCLFLLDPVATEFR